MEIFGESIKERVRQLFPEGGDGYLLVALASLLGMGLVMVYSSSYLYCLDNYQDGFFLTKRHLIFSALGCFGFLIVSRLPVFKVPYGKVVLLGLIVLALSLVFVPGVGVKAGGARRWLNLAFGNVQPAEFVKIGFILLLSKILTEKPRDENDWSLLVKVGVGLIPISLLLLGQPDFGSVVIITLVSLGLLYLAGLGWKPFFGVAIGVGSIFGVLVASSPYRLRRLTSFLDPWADPLNSGFQIIQSFVAHHQGGAFGQGLGNSQAKLYHLPSTQNDFIFSVIGEELGMLGVGLVVFLMGFLVIRTLRVAWRSKDPEGTYFAYGMALLVGLQAFINMGVSLGIVPNKGLTLPFISYGGSSLISLLLGFGLVYRVSLQEASPAAVRKKWSLFTPGLNPGPHSGLNPGAKSRAKGTSKKESSPRESHGYSKPKRPPHSRKVPPRTSQWWNQFREFFGGLNFSAPMVMSQKASGRNPAKRKAKDSHLSKELSSPLRSRGRRTQKRTLTISRKAPVSSLNQNRVGTRAGSCSKRPALRSRGNRRTRSTGGGSSMGSGLARFLNFLGDDSPSRTKVRSAQKPRKKPAKRARPSPSSRSRKNRWKRK